jgi:enoyl-CoA hydratase
MARALAKAAPHAVRTAKRTIGKAFEMPLHAGLIEERRTFLALLATEDAREGVDAFLHKRAPRWKGR